MKNSNKLSLNSRIIIAIGSLGFAIVYFLPVWFIFLIAPQYPEGLTMNIWLDKITGQVDIINGLNHYIGMKHIKAEMFPEFGYLIYILAFIIIAGLLVSIMGKRRFLFYYLIAMFLGAVAAMYDFYSWGYDYGHNLDPKAAIQVPGLFYQPPLIGHKTLLNFDAYSYPDSGGWVIIGIVAIFFLTWFIEWRKAHKKNTAVGRIRKKTMPAVAAMLIFALNSCNSGPQPLSYGKDACDDCKMTIMDPKFAGEIITKKGRIYKFDDLHCISHYLNNNHLNEKDISQIVLASYEEPVKFIDINTAYLVTSKEFKTPMNGNTAAFLNRAAAEKNASQTNGQISQWLILKTMAPFK